MDTKFTNGPWQWEVSASGHVRLATPGRGRLVVMDCVRKGMQRAEPRFAVMDDDQPRGRRGGILRSISELIEEHPEGLLDHPDAHLIAAAPKLYAELENMIALYEHAAYELFGDSEKQTVMLAKADAARAALAAARGEK